MSKRIVTFAEIMLHLLPTATTASFRTISCKPPSAAATAPAGCSGKTFYPLPFHSMTPAANGRRGHALFSVPAVLPPHMQQRIRAALLVAVGPAIDLEAHVPVKAHGMRILFVHRDLLYAHKRHRLPLPLSDQQMSTPAKACGT